MSSGLLVCSCLFLALHGANANAFLKANSKTSGERISAADVQTSLLEEIEGSLGTSTGYKVVELQARLLPIFNALPKNEQGGLSTATVRYALHRMFVQRHGWFVQGLDRAGGAWNESDTGPAGILAEQVPAYIQDLFEKRLAGKGLGLHELAVLAATIEHLVHKEALSKLGEAFQIHSRLPTDTLDVEEASEILETYMLQFVLGEHVSNMSLRLVNRLKKKMPLIYLPWEDTRVFIRGVRTNSTGDAAQLDFAMIARVAERIGEQFGSFQNRECHKLKDTLTKIEDRGSGRVRLPDFYKPAYGGEGTAWQFQESAAYLKQLGALDDSEPENQKVIIANYLGSQANCIASSSFYTVCCMDECESLIGHLEHDIKAPEATPEQILSLVQGLASSSVPAPREVSAKLTSRLHEIAATHGGIVPLHGRLFLQWMHHAYPRECQYPHISGTTAPKYVTAANASGEDPQASLEEIQWIVENDQNNSAVTVESDSDAVDLMPWSHEEELLVVRPATQSTPSHSPVLGGLRGALLFALMASMIAFGVVRNGKLSPQQRGEEPFQKFYV